MALLLMFIFNAGFYINYRVIDKDTMFLPTFIIWALWLGLGYHFLFAWLKENLEDIRMRKWGLSVIKVSVMGAVLLAMIWNWRITDLSNDHSARDRGERILAIAENNSLIFGWWDTIPVIQYLQLVEGQHPDVKAINRFLIKDEDMLQAIQNEIDNRPIYIDSVSKEVLLIARPEREHLLYKLTPQIQIGGGR
jgi:hypothetical protein